MNMFGFLFGFFCSSDEMEKLKIPKDMDDAKALGTVLSKYKDTYYTQVLVAYFATYVLYPWSTHIDLSGEEYLSDLLPAEDVSRALGIQRHTKLQWKFVIIQMIYRN